MRISDWSSDVCSSDLILRLKRVRQALGASERWPSCVRRKQDFEGRLWSSIADALQRLFRTLQRSDLQLRGKCPTVSKCAANFCPAMIGFSSRNAVSPAEVLKEIMAIGVWL